MNIKKLFAVLAGVSMLATQFIPAGALAATYSAELQGAYDWAYSKSITTMSSIDNANMYGAITRAELAKMLANWAKDEGKTPDTSKACNFTDTASVKGDLATAIVESCQLGLMGQGITAFRPYDTISRAEFGTALSRALWGSKYDGATPYYANHLAALKAAGIMNQISNAESTKEVRGYVMLMLQRSEGSEGSSSEVSESDKLMGCLEKCGKDVDCISACYGEEKEDSSSDEVVKAGSLVVSSESADDRSVVVPSTPATLAGGVMTPSAVSDLDTLTFRTSEEVTLNKVVLETYGYSPASATIANIWLEDEDGNQITTKATPNTKGLVNLTVKKDYKAIDWTLNATIVVEMYKTAAGVSGTIGFKVSEVSSSAESVDLGKYKAYKYDVVEYDGATATVSARWGEKDYNYEAGETYEISKFKVKAPEASAILVKSFTLKNDKAWLTPNNLDTHEFLDIDSVEVSVAGETVKANATINKDEELVVTFKKDVEISAKSSVEFVVSAGLNDDFDEYGKQIKFEMTSISATDKNNARITIDTAGVNFVTYTFNGGKIKFTSNKLWWVEAAVNSQDVLIADGTIEVSETIEGNITLTMGTQASFTTCTKANYNNATDCGNAGGLWTATLWPAEAISEIRLAIAGDEIVWEFDSKTIATPVITFKDADISESGKVKIYVDLVDDARFEWKSMTFGSVDFSNLIYSDGTGKIKTSGSVSVSKLTLQKSEGSLSNSISSDEVEFRKWSNETKDIFKWSYTAKKTAINLNKFTLEGNWVPVLNANDNKMHVYLYLGNTQVADAQLDCSANPCKATDTFNNVLVKANESIDVRVEAEVDGSDSNISKAVKFTLTLEWEDENQNPAGIADKQSAKVSVVEKGTPEVEKGTSDNTILLRGAEGAIAEMIVKPSGASSSIDLEEVSFDATWINDCSKLKLVVGNVDKNFELNAGRCVATDFEETIAASGKTLRIELDEEPGESAWLYTAVVDDLYLNDTKVSGSFSKAYADAVISFTQTKRDDRTEYAIANIEKYSAATEVSDIHFYDESGAELVINGLLPTTALSKNDTFTIDNGKQSKDIKKVVYTVKRGTTFTQIVTVTYNPYKDFFKTNDGDLRTYAYTEAAWAAPATIAKAATSAAATDATQINLGGMTTTKTISDLQDSITIDGYSIKGTIKKVSTPNWVYSDAWMPTTYDHFIVLTMDEDTALANFQCDNTSVYDTISSSYKALDTTDCVLIWAVNASSVLKVKNESTGVVNQYFFNEATFEE